MSEGNLSERVSALEARTVEPTAATPSVLQLLLDSTKATADEMKRLRELRHEDVQSLQSFALAITEFREHLKSQDVHQQEFRNSTEKLIGGLQEESKAMTQAINGPPGRISEGMAFKVESFDRLASTINRLIWVVVAAVGVSLVGTVFTVIRMSGK